MEIAKVESGDIGAEVKFEKGQLIIEAKLDSKGIDAAVVIKVPADYFLNKLAEAIPGTIDDQVISLIKLALKA